MKANARSVAAVTMVVILAIAGVWWSRRDRDPGLIVLVTIDTLRADRLPAYGYSRGRTPRLDAFAREAVLFERAYSHAPQTLPAHVSLLTGQLPFEHGVRDNAGFTIAPSTRMLQHDLAARGYATGAFVSAYVLRRETGIASGFATYDDRLPAAAGRSVGQVERDGADTLRAALAWLDARASDRVFLFLHLYEPHAPYAPPERYAGGDPYDGEVTYADEIVGRLFDGLRERALYDSATIVITSDHGEGLGDHVEREHGLFLYDESIRVPLLVKRPDTGRPGTRIAAPVQLIDVRATFDAWTGAPRGADGGGHSLEPLIDGSGPVAPRGVYSEAMYPRYHFGWSELTSLTDDRYRYIRAPREELYDLARDPEERRNLAAERPTVTAAMRAALERLTAGTRTHVPGSIGAEERQRLQALGYVGGGLAAASDDRRARPDPKDKVHALEAYRHAVTLAGERRYAEAATAFRSLLSGEPDMIDAWSQYGQVLEWMGDRPAALQAYREVLTRNPSEAGTLLSAATVLRLMGRLEEAREHATLAVKALPAAAHETLARIALSASDEDAARREADLGSRADAGLPLRDYVEGRIAHARGQYADAAAHLERAARHTAAQTTQLSDLHYHLADSLARLERDVEAAPHFRREIELYPLDPRAYAGLAMLYRARGDAAASNAVVERLLAASPSPEARRIAADLWRMFGETKRAAALARRAPEPRPARNK